MSLINFLFHAPGSDWIHFLIFLFGIIIFIAIAEKTRSALRWSPEVTRKLVHILTGILVFFTPYFFISNRSLIWMAVIFIIVNYIGVKTGSLKGMHEGTRKSYGTVFYPITFLLLVIICWPNYKSVLMISMLILALSDAGAAIVGENLKNPHTYRLGMDKKSFEGSLIMFFITLGICIFLLPLVAPIDGYTISLPTAIWIGLVTSLVATILEAFSSSGSDNITAPLGAAFIISFMLNQPTGASLQFSIGVGLGILIAFLSYWTHILTTSGCVSTFLLAMLIYGLGGWRWTVPIFTFFIISSVLSKLGKKYKSQFDRIFEKSSKRNIGQVLANGSVAGITILANYFFPNPIWYFLYLGSLAAVTADTWATEIGIFSRIPPRSMRNFEKVPPGTSGGITPLGTLFSLLGSCTIVLSGWIVTPISNRTAFTPFLFTIIVLGGFLANLVDSLLGATIQAQYRCESCSKITEKRNHCDGETVLVSGFPWLNSDGVNSICSFCGLVFVWIGLYLFIK